MTYDPELHHRRSVRLPEWDYAAHGWYVVTLVTFARELLFGEITDGMMHLNATGQIVDAEWRRTAKIRDDVTLDAYVVMPNHLHAIVAILGQDRPRNDEHAVRKPVSGVPRPIYRPPRSLGSLVAGFKSAATRRVNALHDTEGVTIWQRSYYEHVIRDERDLDRIRRYIERNPSRWDRDRENPRGMA